MSEANSWGWGREGVCQTSSRAEVGGRLAFPGKRAPCFMVKLTNAPTLPSCSIIP